MSVAITSTYTEHGISARCGNDSVRYSYNHSLSIEGNHSEAVKKLLTKLNLKGNFVGADLCEKKMVWINVKASRFAVTSK